MRSPRCVKACTAGGVVCAFTFAQLADILTSALPEPALRVVTGHPARARSALLTRSCSYTAQFACFGGLSSRVAAAGRAWTCLICAIKLTSHSALLLPNATETNSVLGCGFRVGTAMHPLFPSTLCPQCTPQCCRGQPALRPRLPGGHRPARAEEERCRGGGRHTAPQARAGRCVVLWIGVPCCAVLLLHCRSACGQVPRCACCSCGYSGSCAGQGVLVLFDKSTQLPSIGS